MIRAAIILSLGLVAAALVHSGVYSMMLAGAGDATVLAYRFQPLHRELARLYR
jgi:hypothetical protein